MNELTPAERGTKEEHDYKDSPVHAVVTLATPDGVLIDRIELKRADLHDSEVNLFRGYLGERLTEEAEARWLRMSMNVPESHALSRGARRLARLAAEARRSVRATAPHPAEFATESDGYTCSSRLSHT